MENWLEKYKPNKLSEVLGDKYQIQRIENFIKQFIKKNVDHNKIPNPNLIITGTNGIGKNLITDLVLKQYGFEKITTDLSSLSVVRKTKRKKQNEKEVLPSSRTVKTYYLTLNNKLLPNGEYSDRKIALVFDSVSSISNQKEKEAIKNLIKLNNKFKQFPIIIIAGTKHSKIVNELRKMVTYIVRRKTDDGRKDNRKIINEVLLKPPEFYEIKTFIKNICAKENLNLVQRKNDENDIYAEIILHSQDDIRRLIDILEDLKLIYQDSKITIEQFEHYKETSKTKDLDPGIYEATGLLLNNYTTPDNALLLYGEERATIPLMVHENYPLNIRQQYPKMSVDDQIEILYSISKSISESDKVDGLIYSNQCWSLQSVHGFYSCVMPSYYINKAPNKLHKVEKYKYTQDYNKTSIKKINNKAIKKVQKHQFFKKVSIYDFLYIAFILKTLLDRKEFKTVANLMKPYKLKLKEIESIIKIDKIKKLKNTLTGKERTLLKELLDVEE